MCCEDTPPGARATNYINVLVMIISIMKVITIILVIYNDDNDP